MKIKKKLNLVFAKKNPHRFWTIFGQNLEKKGFFRFFQKVPKTPVLTLFCSRNMTKSNFHVQFSDINSRVSMPSEVIFIPNLSSEFSKNSLFCPIKPKRYKNTYIFSTLGKYWQNYLKKTENVYIFLS